MGLNLMMQQDFNQMALFAMVAEQGSFTKAAKQLAIPKSSISRHISQLEERLNARLINRTTRSMTLTEVGKMYLEHCKRIVEEAESAQASLASQQSEPSGHLKVTAPLAFGAPLFLDVFQQFLKDYPNINIELFLDNRVIDLVNEEVDVAIRVGPLQPSSLVARCIGRTVQCLCATPAYLKQHGEPETIEELSQHNVIKHPNIPLILERDKVISTSSRFLANDMSVIVSLALNHQGIALLPLPLVHQHVSSGELIPILLEYPMEGREFFLVYPSRRQLATKVMAFVDYFIQYVQGMNYWNVSVEEFMEMEGIVRVR